MRFAVELSRGAAEQRTSIENPSVPVSQTTEFMAFFGLDSATLPRVTIDSALTVPAVAATVAFLSRTLAALPLHAYQGVGDDRMRLNDEVETALHDAWNDETDAFEARQYFWQQVFTGGRGLAWIERGGKTVNLWPMVPSKVAIKRVGGRKVYRYEGREYAARDVIDVPFMLKPDQLAHWGPITLAAKAIQLALAMTDYAATFFAGGGVPPLTLVGPLPAGSEAMGRTLSDIKNAIDHAKASGKPILPIPGGYELKPIGLEPGKSQMEQARLFQVQEIARVYNMPPVFVGDLSKGTFANVEQQDLHLVKHLIGQWAEAFESEATLKIYGRGPDRDGRYIEHNLDGLQRGDFKSRTEAMARAIQTAQLTPNEARALDNRPNHANPVANELLVQGATVVLGQQPAAAVAAEHQI
jgi:HK97 family phage portal protein